MCAVGLFACGMAVGAAALAKATTLGSFLVEKSETYSGPFRQVRPGDRQKTVLITWSHTLKHANAASRQDALKRIGDALEEIKAEKRSSVDLLAARIAVFEERHLSGEKHYHILVDLPAKSTLPSYLGQRLRKSGVCVDVRAAQGESGNLSSVDRMLNYCLVVTEDKWLVDTEPLLYNFEIPPKIADLAKKAAGRLGKRPASLDDLYEFLRGNPSVSTPAALDKLIQGELAKKGQHAHHHLPYTRLRLLASRLGQTFAREFQSQYSRAISLFVDTERPYAAYYRDALQAECVCPQSGLLANQLRSGVAFHDEKEYYCPKGEFSSSRSHLGSYYRHLVGDNFPARQQCLVLCGAMGSGKSVVARQHFEVFPTDGRCDLRECFVFKPALGDSFPFTGISDVAKFIDLNDFRTSLDGVPPSAILNLAEFAPTRLPQKGAAPETVQARLVISTNYLSPAGMWKSEDLEALVGPKGRTFGGIIEWRHPLPTHGQCGRCRKCSASFMDWCMSAVSAGKKRKTESSLASQRAGDRDWADFDEP